MNISAKKPAFGTIYVNVPFQKDKKDFKPLRKKLEQHSSNHPNNLRIERDPYNFLDDFIINSTPKNERAIVKALHRTGFEYSTKNIKVNLGKLLFQREAEDSDKVVKGLKLETIESEEIKKLNEEKSKRDILYKKWDSL